MEVEGAVFIVEEVPESSETTNIMTLKDRVLGKLDQVEAHVEELRKSAAYLENRKDQILTTLHAMKTMESLSEFDENDKEDILRYLGRISRRCTTIEVCVHTDRSNEQVESLHQVNRLIDSLIVGMKDNPEHTQVRCVSYLSACSSSSQDTEGDKTFECAVLGCALDDQKRIKQRLSGLLDYMTREKWKGAIQPME